MDSITSATSFPLRCYLTSIFFAAIGGAVTGTWFYSDAFLKDTRLSMLEKSLNLPFIAFQGAVNGGTEGVRQMAIYPIVLLGYLTRRLITK